MDYKDLKLTSSEIGSLWTLYVNGTVTDCVNKYMLSIIEDESIKRLFKEAVEIFSRQKQQIAKFIKNEGFPEPLGFTDADLNKNTKRLFSDIFCLQYLNIMTIHGLVAHTTSLSIAVRKDLRETFDSFADDGKSMYHKTTELLLEKGQFQRDPYVFPQDNVQFINTNEFSDGFFKTTRSLSAPEIVSLSLNIKKNILAKTLSIGFSQVAQSKEVREFLIDSQNTVDAQIKSLSELLQNDNLPVPKSWETEVTSSQQSPFSDKLMLAHIGFLFQVGQVYHGTGLASSMRTDLLLTYEKIILKNIMVTNNWFNLMVRFKWLEQPPLLPNRLEAAKNK